MKPPTEVSPGPNPQAILDLLTPKRRRFAGAEIINHSCNPNLVSRILKGHVLYMSLRTIKPGEELTVNYNFDKDVRTFPCSCGAPSCGGAIGKSKD